jgi:hypothetical protein
MKSLRARTGTRTVHVRVRTIPTKSSSQKRTFLRIRDRASVKENVEIEQS